MSGEEAKKDEVVEAAAPTDAEVSWKPSYPQPPRLWGVREQR